MTLHPLTIVVLVLFGIGLLLLVVFRKKARERLAQLSPEQRAIALKQRSLSLILMLAIVLSQVVHDLGPQRGWSSSTMTIALVIEVAAFAILVMLFIRLHLRNQRLTG